VYLESVLQNVKTHGASQKMVVPFSKMVFLKSPHQFFLHVEFFKNPMAIFLLSKEPQALPEWSLCSARMDPYSAQAHLKPMTSGFTLHLMKRFSNLKCSSHLVSHFEECSPSVVVNCEFMCSELHGTCH
jgi:hypothetical protein